MQKARYHSLCCSNSLFAHGFRFYFTPLTAVLFTFPSRYLFTFGHVLVFSLAGWSPLLHAKFLVCRTTQGSGHQLLGRYRAVTSYRAAFHQLYIRLPRIMPALQPQETNLSVWTVPGSFATTTGIAFAFSSSPY
jgi:hypothetical protein